MTVATYTDPYAAYLARSRLEAEGIESFVFDDTIVRMNRMFTYAVGGVKLRVHVDDADRAANVLATPCPEAACLGDVARLEPSRPGVSPIHDPERLAEAEARLRLQQGEDMGTPDTLASAWPALVMVVIVGVLIALYFSLGRHPAF